MQGEERLRRRFGFFVSASCNLSSERKVCKFSTEQLQLCICVAQEITNFIKKDNIFLFIKFSVGLHKPHIFSIDSDKTQKTPEVQLVLVLFAGGVPGFRTQALSHFALTEAFANISNEIKPFMCRENRFAQH